MSALARRQLSPNQQCVHDFLVAVYQDLKNMVKDDLLLAPLSDGVHDLESLSNMLDESARDTYQTCMLFLNPDNITPDVTRKTTLSMNLPVGRTIDFLLQSDQDRSSSSVDTLEFNEQTKQLQVVPFQERRHRPRPGTFEVLKLDHLTCNPYPNALKTYNVVSCLSCVFFTDVNQTTFVPQQEVYTQVQVPEYNEGSRRYALVLYALQQQRQAIRRFHEVHSGVSAASAADVVGNALVPPPAPAPTSSREKEYAVAKRNFTVFGSFTLLVILLAFFTNMYFHVQPEIAQNVVHNLSSPEPLKQVSTFQMVIPTGQAAEIANQFLLFPETFRNNTVPEMAHVLTSINRAQFRDKSFFTRLTNNFWTNKDTDPVLIPITSEADKSVALSAIQQFNSELFPKSHFKNAFIKRAFETAFHNVTLPESSLNSVPENELVLGVKLWTLQQHLHEQYFQVNTRYKAYYSLFKQLYAQLDHLNEQFQRVHSTFRFIPVDERGKIDEHMRNQLESMFTVYKSVFKEVVRILYFYDAYKSLLPPEVAEQIEVYVIGILQSLKSMREAKNLEGLVGFEKSYLQPLQKQEDLEGWLHKTIDRASTFLSQYVNFDRPIIVDVVAKFLNLQSSAEDPLVENINKMMDCQRYLLKDLEKNYETLKAVDKYIISSVLTSDVYKSASSFHSLKYQVNIMTQGLKGFGVSGLLQLHTMFFKNLVLIYPRLAEDSQNQISDLVVTLDTLITHYKELSTEDLVIEVATEALVKIGEVLENIITVLEQSGEISLQNTPIIWNVIQMIRVSIWVNKASVMSFKAGYNFFFTEKNSFMFFWISDDYKALLPSKKPSVNLKVSINSMANKLYTQYLGESNENE